MNPRIQKLAELAFAMALSDQVAPTLSHGRLKNLLNKLSAGCVSEIRSLKKINNQEREQARKLIMMFADKTKWEGKPLHICTKVNFMLALYDEREYGKTLIPILNNIYDYFARAKDAPKACEWSGALAVTKWEEVLNRRMIK